MIRRIPFCTPLVEVNCMRISPVRAGWRRPLVSSMETPLRLPFTTIAMRSAPKRWRKPAPVMVLEALCRWRPVIASTA